MGASRFHSRRAALFSWWNCDSATIKRRFIHVDGPMTMSTAQLESSGFWASTEHLRLSPISGSENLTCWRIADGQVAEIVAAPTPPFRSQSCQRRQLRVPAVDVGLDWDSIRT